MKADVSIAKNYLSKGEIQELNEIVTMYLDYATRQARRHIPMTMEDWASKLDAFLQLLALIDDASGIASFSRLAYENLSCVKH